MAVQLAFFPIPNPCKGVCQVDARGYCRGCMRSRDERFNWMQFSDEQKNEILRLCHQRKMRHQRTAKSTEADAPQQLSLF